MSASPNWSDEYPFASHKLELSGHRLHYLDEGQGPPVLAVHGNPTWSFYWRRLVQALRGRYRCLVPDHMGCGLSDKPQDYPYQLEQHIDNLCRLVEQLDLRDITLVAHDWGGAIGMGAATRLSSRFARFVLLNTAAFRSTRMPWRIRLCRVPLLGPLLVRGLNGFARAATWMATTQPGGLRPAARAGLLHPYGSWHDRVAILRFVQDIPLSRAHLSYTVLEQIEQRLPQLADRPLLLIWGMKDWCFTPQFLWRFREIFPSAQVLELPNTGHYVMEDAPDQTIAAVEQFLSASSAAPVDTLPRAT